MLFTAVLSLCRLVGFRRIYLPNVLVNYMWVKDESLFKSSLMQESWTRQLFEVGYYCLHKESIIKLHISASESFREQLFTPIGTGSESYSAQNEIPMPFRNAYRDYIIYRYATRLDWPFLVPRLSLDCQGSCGVILLHENLLLSMYLVITVQIRLLPMLPQHWVQTARE